MTRASQELISDDVFADADPEVIAILDEYLAAVEQGRPVEVEELLARRPELASELTAYFESINFLQIAAPDLTGFSDSTAMLEDWSGQTLGEYAIVRELGRGGMGVVYEATQDKLGRRVALKVLPFAAVLDKKQTARFMLEAQAAAQLTHPNIVPVYGVGCERGVHYYSMQYIEGRSLEAAIRELEDFRQAQLQRLRRPQSTRQVEEECSVVDDPNAADTRTGFSTSCSTQDRSHALAVAQLGIQAADALQHAHDFGVVHRDIKPSNLLLDRDGKLWVTDFGLARCQADSTITLTGAVLGTVRYMSPEQAAGRRALVDHRTDIYSLGVTLYELLTLRTPYDADTCHEFLHQVERGEPAALRRMNPAVPFDLETIVLKAISKLRRHRYATAQELADDLRRFVGGKTIAARRPSLVDRVAKWTARHKNFVTSAAVILLLALIGMTGAAIMIAHEKAATEAALAESRGNFQQAQDNFRQAREVLDHFGVLVADRLSGVPGAERIRKEVLQDTLRYYDQFVAKAGDDPALRADLAVTCFKAGEILNRLGAGDEALRSYEKARRILEQLAGDDARGQLAACHNNIGLLHAAQGNVEAAQAAYEQAIELYGQRLAVAPEKAPSRLQLAATLGNLALLLDQTGSPDESLAYHRRALKLQQQLVDDYPMQVAFRRELAMTLNNLSFLHRGSDVPRAIDFNRQAIDLLRQAASEEPDNVDFRSDLALSMTNHGALLAGGGRHALAEEAYREAIALYESLREQAPNVFAYRRDLAVAQNNLGRTLNELQRFEAAQQALQDARDVLVSLSKDAPQEVALLSSLGGVLNNLGMAYEQTGDRQAAIEAYEQAIVHQHRALSKAPRMATFARFLTRSRQNYARVLEAVGRSREAEEVREQIRTQVPAPSGKGQDLSP